MGQGGGSVLEVFRRMWLGWNVLVRKIVSGQTWFLMTITWFVGLAPVAIGLKLMRKTMIDRAPADPNAPTYGLTRTRGPLDMKGASRMF